MSGICGTCVTAGCSWRTLRCNLGFDCSHYTPKSETNYERLFGTPERAAQLIADNCEYLSYCGQCWVRAANCDGKYSTVLEWLRGDA